ncbi:MAG: TonB-dependent receptor [Acidobacteria bacterium]|nr:TonB-dependent receptor [Acidobacteriota bacterium]
MLIAINAAALRAQEAANTQKNKPTAAGAQPSPSSAGEISGTQLLGLPLNGRSYGQLATLQAGVSDPGAEQSSRGGGGGNLTISGGRSTSNNFLMDGTNIMNTLNQLPRSAAGVQLGSDAVLQVQVFSTNYGADYGRSSGGVLNSITRSGTDKFHGTLFEYFRNSKLDARNFFDPETPPPFNRNQFGFVLTGPIRKGSTFFMTSYEAMRDRLSEITNNFFPDVAARQGMLTDAQGNITQIVPVAPSVKPYLALYPLPNGPSLGRGVGQNRARRYLVTNENFFVTRLDHKISEQDGIFGRYVFDDAVSDTGQAAFIFTNRNRTRQQFLTVVESHIFNPRILTSFRASFTRPVGRSESLVSMELPPSTYFVKGAPQFGQIFHSGLTPFGPNGNTPESNIMNSFQFAGDLLARKGSHALKLGFDIHRYQWHTSNSSNRSAAWRFNSLENYLRAGEGGGVTVTVALPSSDNTKNFLETLTGIYLQDAYSVTQRLQVNVGIRYEPATLLHDRDGKTAYLADPWRDPAVTVGPYLDHNPSLKNFSPRFGLTWSPFGGNHTVIRTGFGIYYDQLLAYMADDVKSSVPFHATTMRTNFDPSPFFPDAVAAVKALDPIPFQAQIMDYRNAASPMVLRYNFALQQQLPAGVRFQASYVGGRGNHLYRAYEVNLFPIPIRRADGSLFFPDDCTPTPQHQPTALCQAKAGAINPAFQGGVTMLGTDAQSFYNALQLSVGKSMGQWFSLQANYTFSKSVDDASTIGPAPGAPQSGSAPYGMSRTLDRGLSDFDIRHRLALNYFFNLPALKGDQWWNSGLAGGILNGWRLGGILSLRSGAPFTAAVNLVSPGFAYAPTRPNLVAGHSNNPVKGTSEGCYGVIRRGEKLGTPDRYYDPCALEPPAPGTLGNLGRNTIISPSVFGLDVSLQKDFPLSAEKRLQFRAEIFNVSNRANFNRVKTGGLNVFTGNPARLNPTTAIIEPPTVTTARQIQFALRLSF